MEHNGQDSVDSKPGTVTPNSAAMTVEQSVKNDGEVKKKRNILCEPFPWFKEFHEMCSCSEHTDNIKGLIRLIKVYIGYISRDVSCCRNKPSRACKIKQNLSRVLTFLHFRYSEMKLTFDDPDYFELMGNLLTMYIQIGVKASRRGKESSRSIARKNTAMLFMILKNSPDHIIDTLLKAPSVYKQRFKEMFIPTIWKVITLRADKCSSGLTYIRFLFIYKVLKQLIQNPELRSRLNKLAVAVLKPMPRLTEMIVLGKLYKVLPDCAATSVPQMTRHYLITKFDLKNSIKEFFKMTTWIKCHWGRVHVEALQYYQTETRPLITGVINVDAEDKDPNSENWDNPENSPIVTPHEINMPGCLQGVVPRPLRQSNYEATTNIPLIDLTDSHKKTIIANEENLTENHVNSVDSIGKQKQEGTRRTCKKKRLKRKSLQTSNQESYQRDTEEFLKTLGEEEFQENTKESHCTLSNNNHLFSKYENNNTVSQNASKVIDSTPIFVDDCNYNLIHKASNLECDTFIKAKNVMTESKHNFRVTVRNNLQKDEVATEFPPAENRNIGGDLHEDSQIPTIQHDNMNLTYSNSGNNFKKLESFEAYDQDNAGLRRSDIIQQSIIEDIPQLSKNEDNYSLNLARKHSNTMDENSYIEEVPKFSMNEENNCINVANAPFESERNTAETLSPSKVSVVDPYKLLQPDRLPTKVTRKNVSNYFKRCENQNHTDKNLEGGIKFHGRQDNYTANSYQNNMDVNREKHDLTEINDFPDESHSPISNLNMYVKDHATRRVIRNFLAYSSTTEPNTNITQVPYMISHINNQNLNVSTPLRSDINHFPTNLHVNSQLISNNDEISKVGLNEHDQISSDNLTMVEETNQVSNKKLQSSNEHFSEQDFPDHVPSHYQGSDNLSGNLNKINKVRTEEEDRISCNNSTSIEDISQENSSSRIDKANSTNVGLVVSHSDVITQESVTVSNIVASDTITSDSSTRCSSTISSVQDIPLNPFICNNNQTSELTDSRQPVDVVHHDIMEPYEFDYLPVAQEVEICSDGVVVVGAEINSADWPVGNEQIVNDNSFVPLPSPTPALALTPSPTLIPTPCAGVDQTSAHTSVDLQQVLSDKIRSNSNVKNNKLHYITFQGDRNMCGNQMRFKEFFLYQKVAPTIPVPFPLGISGKIQGLSGEDYTRCDCDLCVKNHKILMSNYKKLNYMRDSLKHNEKKKSPVPFSDKDHNIDADSNLPPKKRKICVSMTSPPKESLFSYPNKPMMSIAQLELPHTLTSSNVMDWTTSEPPTEDPVNLVQSKSTVTSKQKKQIKRKTPSRRRKSSREKWYLVMLRSGG